MSEELKTCPFCGSKAIGDLFDGPKGIYASCSNEECCMNNVGVPEHMWNTRHIPEGYAIVPIEPTRKMILAGGYAVEWRDYDEDAIAAYKAMIKAAQEES